MTGKRAPRTTRGKGPNLSRELVVGAALEYIDQEGIDSFSLRNLATKLGVYPTAIYWHVPTRNDILAQVVALTLENVAPSKKRRIWQKHLQDIFHNFREAVRAHPNVAPLIGTQLVSNTTMGFAFVENLLEVLSRAGLKDHLLVAGYNSVIAALVGFVAQEFAPIPRENPSAWQISVQERMLTISRAEYPTLTDNLSQLSNHAFILRWQNGVDAPLDDSFDFYVQMVVAGIEKLIEKQ